MNKSTSVLFFKLMDIIVISAEKKDSKAFAEKALKLVTGMEDILLHDNAGRPYFENGSREISISHSGKLWVCVLSKEVCGIDIEEIKERKTGGLSRKYFTLAEQEYVKENGTEGFYTIWTRKESYLKLTGMGIKDGLSSFDTTEKGLCCFQDLIISEGYSGSVCTHKEEELHFHFLGE